MGDQYVQVRLFGDGGNDGSEVCNRYPTIWLDGLAQPRLAQNPFKTNAITRTLKK